MQIKFVKTVFPTRVGMNRNTINSSCGIRGIPHTRGDEPMSLMA